MFCARGRIYIAQRSISVVEGSLERAGIHRGWDTIRVKIRVSISIMLRISIMVRKEVSELW